MTSPDERTTITLDYLKGKRRAEKALGFLTDIGQRLLSCTTREEISRTIADHLIRLNIAVCLLAYHPRDGVPVIAESQVPDLADKVADQEELIDQCQQAAASLTNSSASPLEQSATTVEVAGTKVLLRQVALNHDGASTGSLTVGRLATSGADFSPAELALLSDVATRFLTAVRCISK